MVYIDRNGRVCESRPWDLSRFTDIFVGLWFMIVQFFRTLFAPFNKAANAGNGRSNGRGGWGGGGGGGGGGGNTFGRGNGRGGGGGGLGPNRRIGRITNTMDCNIPGGG